MEKYISVGCCVKVKLNMEVESKQAMETPRDVEVTLIALLFL
jgi:hypothetical protein